MIKKRIVLTSDGVIHQWQCCLLQSAAVGGVVGGGGTCAISIGTLTGSEEVPLTRAGVQGQTEARTVHAGDWVTVTRAEETAHIPHLHHTPPPPSSASPPSLPHSPPCPTGLLALMAAPHPKSPDERPTSLRANTSIRRGPLHVGKTNKQTKEKRNGSCRRRSAPEEAVQREVFSWLLVLPFFWDYLTCAGS